MSNNDNDLEVLEKFAHSILKDMKSLESDISQLVDEHFWDLVQNLKKNNMIFYRFGDIPEDECSSIWNNNDEVIGKEKGVSVYEAHKNINGTYSPVIPFPTNEKAFNDFIHHVAYFTGNKYLVTGNLLDETGTDGEPLIKNVKILKELQLMKREIKFKAKRLDGKGWVEGSLIRSTTGIKERAYIVDNFSSMSDYSVIGVDPSTVCQFTGLKDCEGKEVWEGDILHNINSLNQYTIMYSDFGAFFMRKNGTKDLDIYLFQLIRKYECIILFEVVGNKFDKENKV